MTCDFKSFSTALQSYQHDGMLIMKGRVQRNTFMAEKISPPAGIELEAVRSVCQRLTHALSYRGLLAGVVMKDHRDR